MQEARRRPALILGTSSDRIGTPLGQSFYLTLSKDLGDGTGVPIAPYAGVAYGTFEDRARAIGGVNIRFGGGLTSLLIFDGVHLHPTFSYARGRHGLSLLLIRSQDLGLSYNVRF